jgi:hypothetical protein
MARLVLMVAVNILTIPCTAIQYLSVRKELAWGP